MLYDYLDSHLRNHKKIKVVKLIFCEALKKNRFYCEGKAFIEQNHKKTTEFTTSNV
jgi:hypothetical protein